MSGTHLPGLIHAAAGKRVVCVGDVMLDRFIYGGVTRISPEAPVPIMRRTREAAMPGGAGNVARNLASLGLSVSLIGVVGDDGEGRELAALLGDIEGVDADLIAMRDRSTTLKTRFVAGGQQLLRVDAEDTSPIGPSPEAELIASIADEANEASVIILSDYAKGAVTDGVIAAALAAGDQYGIPVIADPKGRDFTRYGAVDLLKPNASELAAAMGLRVETDQDVGEALTAAQTLLMAKSIVVTRAAKGMSYAIEGEPAVHLSGQAREVYDVSGAGDTSIAALALGLAGGGSVADAAWRSRRPGLPSARRARLRSLRMR